MRRFLPAALLALLVSCSQEVTVLTWNVGVFSKYTEDSTPEVAELIRSTGAAMVSLNELDSCNRRHDSYQLDTLASAAGMPEFRFGRAISFGGGAYGNGILSKDKIDTSFIVHLPSFGGMEDRSLLVVETPRMVFGSVHLQFSHKEAALKQAQIINDWFTIHYTGCEKPVILCGDMNSKPDWPAVQELSRLWDVLTPPDSTCGPSCIDYIFSFKTARPVKLKHAEVLDNSTASNHRPVLVRFKPGKPRKSFTFIHASDTQVGFIDETPAYRYSDSLFAAAVRTWNAMKPLLIVNTGDLVNQPSDSLENFIYNARKAEIEAPYYEIPGNHDMLGWKKDNYYAPYTALREGIRFSFVKEGCAFIGIDSNCIKDGMTAEEEEQLGWLRGELAAASRCAHRFLFLHCPIIKTAIDEPEDYFNFSIPKREEYISLLKEYDVEAVFCGHTHMDYCMENDGILFAAAGPVGSSLGRGYPGFAVVNVSDQGVVWEYVATMPF